MIMTEIKNREQVVAALTALLMQFDKDCNSYQTDVYMYVDDDGNAALDTFVNVGGNSWRNDDHYTIYRDKGHFESWLDCYWDDISDIEYCLNVCHERLVAETAKYLGWDEEDVEDRDIRDYVYQEPKYSDILFEEYLYAVTSNATWYEEQAEEIVSAWETEIREELERRSK